MEEFFAQQDKAAKDYYESLDTSNVKTYLVGGAVREIVRGFPEKVKDWDFAVEAESYLHMKKWLEYNDFHIFLETPQYLTIRARAPREDYVFAGIDMTGKAFDFTLCREEGGYSDGRRPDEVKPGTLMGDLKRRDFTMNAMALDASGILIDPFDGALDIKRRLIRCVGGVERLREDSLRMLRAIRFAIQLDFDLSNEVYGHLHEEYSSYLLKNISDERIREELTKCFKTDTMETLYYLNTFRYITEEIFSRGMWLLPTVKGK